MPRGGVRTLADAGATPASVHALAGSAALLVRSDLPAHLRSVKSRGSVSASAESSSRHRRNERRESALVSRSPGSGDGLRLAVARRSGVAAAAAARLAARPRAGRAPAASGAQHAADESSKSERASAATATACMLDRAEMTLVSVAVVLRRSPVGCFAPSLRSNRTNLTSQIW